MNLQTYRLTLQPLTAFGTPLAGDTLFGQLCWALRHLYGNACLEKLLHDSYTSGKPFLVVGDAFPHDHLPLPSLPSGYWNKGKEEDRKELKKMRWLPRDKITEPLPDWQQAACNDAKAVETITGSKAALHSTETQPHNSINRATGTTGEGAFAPYGMAQIWFAPGIKLDIYLVLDEARLSLAELAAAMDYIGNSGYGRDASIGLGKFERVGDIAPSPLVVAGRGEGAATNANSYLTLGPCAPQGQGFCSTHSYYQTVTRFGRHGDVEALKGQPFKRPVLLARAGAVFRPETVDPACRFIGQGLDGVSPSQPEAVQQGYAPVVAIAVPDGAST